MKTFHERAFERIIAGVLALLAGIAVVTGTPARAQEKLIPLQVTLGDVDITKIVAVVAYEEGIYKKNGLDVQQFISPGAAQVIKGNGVIVPREYVRSVSAPVTISGGTPLMVSRATNWRAHDRIILASLDQIVHWHIIARPGINKLEDLKGKRLGYSGVGAMTHFIALALARKMGWDPNFDLSLMSNANEMEPLQKGAVDAIVAPGIALVMAQKAGMKPLADLRTWNLPIAGSGVQTTASWVKDNRETARRFIKSLVEAIALMKQDKQAAFRGMAKWYNITDPEIQEMIYRGAEEMPRKPYPAVDGIKETMKLYDSAEMRKHKPEDFYDDSFVRELDQSGYIDSLYKK